MDCLSKLEMPRAVVLLKTLAAYRNLQGRIEFFRCDGIHPTIVSLRIVHKRVPCIRTIQFGHACAVILQELQVQRTCVSRGKGTNRTAPSVLKNGIFGRGVRSIISPDAVSNTTWASVYGTSGRSVRGPCDCSTLRSCDAERINAGSDTTCECNCDAPGRRPFPPFFFAITHR